MPIVVGGVNYPSPLLWGNIFQTGATFDVGSVTVESFSIPHDAQDPVNFLLRTPSGNIGFLTDLGHVTKLVLERVRSANVLVLEANHDIKMLPNGNIIALLVERKTQNEVLAAGFK